MVTPKCVFSQNKDDKFLPGYVVSFNGDTISGTIKQVGDLRSCYVVIMNTGSEKRKKYYPNDLKSYYKNNEFYETHLTTMGDSIFMRKIISGKLNMFYQFTANVPMGISVGALISYAVLDNDNIVVYLLKDGETRPTRINSVGFKNRMSEYLKDYPWLVEKINNKDLRYHDLPEIVQLFNESQK